MPRFGGGLMNIGGAGLRNRLGGRPMGMPMAPAGGPPPMPPRMPPMPPADGPPPMPPAAGPAGGPPPMPPMMPPPPAGAPAARKGGKVKSKVKKMAKGGSAASKRADGCCTKGKTKGRFV